MLPVLPTRPIRSPAATSITQTGVYVGAAVGPIGFGLAVSHFGYGSAWPASMFQSVREMGAAAPGTLTREAASRITQLLQAAAEARRDEYGWLPPLQRQRATILKPGSMYVHQPRLPVPLLVEFPFPAWATRSAEADVGRGALDPDTAFDGLT